jgi:ABC-type Fe3+/spermidine/putrescine transport system ATPase subunit
MLELKEVRARAGDFELDRVSVTVPSQSYAVLLGPPGSGKSVLIETICGLRRVDAGRIFLERNDITDLAPRDRRIGYVPQDYALFRTKPVRKNILFGLRARGVSCHEAAERIRPIIDLLELEPLLDRWPGTLSGGEQQRVALARALATRPRLLLLDEPVSALDESTRDTVCRELRRIQGELGITTLHISHNLEEAFSVADVALVMRNGAIVQSGSMDDLVRRPDTPFVARFLRAQNVFEGQAEGTTVRVGTLELATAQPTSGPVSVMVRPERVHLSSQAPSGNEGTVLPMRVERAVDRGPYVRVDLTGDVPLVAHLSHRGAKGVTAESGRHVYAILEPDDVFVIGEKRADGGEGRT